MTGRGRDPHRLLHAGAAGVGLDAAAAPAAAQRAALADAHVAELPSPAERADVGPPVEDQPPTDAGAQPHAEREPGAPRRAGHPFPQRAEVGVVAHGRGPSQPLAQQHGHRHRLDEPGQVRRGGDHPADDGSWHAHPDRLDVAAELCDGVGDRLHDRLRPPTGRVGTRARATTRWRASTSAAATFVPPTSTPAISAIRPV